MITQIGNRGYVAGVGLSKKPEGTDGAAKSRGEGKVGGAEKTERTGRMERTDGISIRLTSKNGIPVDPLERQEPVEIKEPEMPKNFILQGEMDMHLTRTFKKLFQDYYSGEADDRDVKQTMDDAVSSLIDSFTQKGFHAEEITPRIIENVYEYCRMYAMSAIGSASYYEGKKFAEQFKDYSSISGKMYYNSDYYYKGEEMKDLLLDHAQGLADQYGVTEIKLFRNYPEGDIRKGIYDSYNTVSNEHTRNFFANMVDETMVPPKGFRLFYINNDSGTNHFPLSMGSGDGTPESFFDGGLHIWYGDWNFSGRVPVRMDTTRYPSSVNMMDVVQNFGQSFPKEIEAFLGNFDFYSTVTVGAYTRSHARKY